MRLLPKTERRVSLEFNGYTLLFSSCHSQPARGESRLIRREGFQGFIFPVSGGQEKFHNQLHIGGLLCRLTITSNYHPIGITSNDDSR